MYPGLFLIVVFLLLWFALGIVPALVIVLAFTLLGDGGYTVYDRRRW